MRSVTEEQEAIKRELRGIRRRGQRPIKVWLGTRLWRELLQADVYDENERQLYGIPAGNAGGLRRWVIERESDI